MVIPETCKGPLLQESLPLLQGASRPKSSSSSLSLSCRESPRTCEVTLSLSSKTRPPTGWIHTAGMVFKLSSQATMATSEMKGNCVKVSSFLGRRRDDLSFHSSRHSEDANPSWTGERCRLGTPFRFEARRRQLVCFCGKGRLERQTSSSIVIPRTSLRHIEGPHLESESHIIRRNCRISEVVTLAGKALLVHLRDGT